MSGLCDRCQRPGRCCSGFPLVGSHTLDEATRGKPAEVVEEELLNCVQPTVNGMMASLPFKPMYQAEKDEGLWRFWCPMWKHGRCSIYETRPALCDHYKPLDDALCWHTDTTLLGLMPKSEYVEKGINIDLRHETAESLAERVADYKNNRPFEAEGITKL